MCSEKKSVPNSEFYHQAEIAASASQKRLPEKKPRWEKSKDEDWVYTIPKLAVKMQIPASVSPVRGESVLSCDAVRPAKVGLERICMRCTRISSLAGLVLTLSFSACNLLVPQNAATANAVGKYIQAIQKGDFKTVIDLTYSYQQDVAGIKAANPQALWSRLVEEYYRGKESSFAQQGAYWQSYGEALGAMTGDPAQTIRALRDLVRRSCKWKITESRTDQVQDSIAFGPYERSRVYVMVDYPSVTSSPIFNQKLLKETTLEFTMNAKSQLVMAVAKLDQADLYWTTGGTDVRIAMAKRFLAASLWDPAILQLEPLEAKNELTPEGRDLLAQAYFRHVTHQCLSMNMLGRYPQFSESAECLADIKRAVALKPGLREDWANVLLSDCSAGIQVGQFDSASYFVKMASEYVGGNEQLRNRAEKLRLEIALEYFRQAMDGYGQWRVSAVQEKVGQALRISPDVLRSPAALERVKDKIRKAVAQKNGGNFYAGYFVADALGFMVAVHMPVPSEDAPDFLKWASFANDPAKWRREVAKLASGRLAPE